MKELESFAAGLLDDLSALPEDGMRLGLFARRLSGRSADEVALLFEAVFRKGIDQRRSGKALSVFLDPEGLKKALGEGFCADVYRASLRQGLKRVSRFFTDLPAHKKGLAGYDKEEEARMEFLSLGQRRSLSRRNDKDTIDRLLSDPDPVVVANLLNNPRATEKEVLKIASKRPNSPQIIKTVLGHRVWSKRYSVKKAIAMNPYTPPRLSLALLELMLTQDLKRISEDKTLHPQVRMSAKEMLDSRGFKG